jgi:hypothetical protein
VRAIIFTHHTRIGDRLRGVRDRNEGHRKHTIVALCCSRPQSPFVLNNLRVAVRETQRDLRNNKKKAGMTPAFSIHGMT